MNKWTVQITFLTPFRIVKWQDRETRKQDRAYRRGGTFARWHMINRKNDTGRPYITGSLLRSALFAQLEDIRGLLIPENHNELIHFACCGMDVSKDRIPAFLRRRAVYLPGDASPPKDRHTWCGKCALCILMGRSDKDRDAKHQKEKDIRKWTVHFDNLREHDPKKGTAEREFVWNETAESRIMNRVDFYSGKAKDYMRIWEIEEGYCRSVRGDIRFHLPADLEKNNPELLSRMQAFMAAGLTQIRSLAGGLCRVDIAEGADHDALICKFHDALPPDPKPPETKIKSELPKFPPSPKKGKGIPDIPGTAKSIAAVYEEEQRYEKIRRLADAVRELRCDPGLVSSLPSAKGDARKNQTVWDRELPGSGRSLREELKISAEGKEKSQWRTFCEALGLALYEEAKKSRSASVMREQARTLPRLLGETEFYGLPMKKEEEESPVLLNVLNLPDKQWILDAKLTSLGPFFFGKESGKEQTSAPILLSRDGHFRLPRSVIRGALRRDLRLVMQKGCNSPVGGPLCPCPVCRIMRRVLVSDALSPCDLPPRLRYRIRIHPHNQTVEEGALFDTECGFQGLFFPLRMYIRTAKNEMDKELLFVLSQWKKEQAFLGGDTGTGMGRFRLESPELWYSDLSKERKNFWLNRGYTGLSGAEIKELPQSPRLRKMKEVKPDQFLTLLPWQEYPYSLTVISPLISRDPVSALLDPRCPDTVMIRKTILDYPKDSRTSPESSESSEAAEKQVYFIKAESIRGLLRHLISKNRDESGKFLWQLDHEDCNCLQCRLFGSVHRKGQLRFEDAEIYNEKEERLLIGPENSHDRLMDHVAIDRFTSGSTDQMKFNEYPLPASPDYPLILKSRIWLHRDTDEKDRQALGKALAQMQQMSLGGLGAIGYGRVGEFVFSEKPDWIPEFSFLQQITENRRMSFSNAAPETSLEKGKIYHPHCFIATPENKSVNRTTSLVSHAEDKDNEKNPLFSGEIRCTLSSLGPFFIPDTENENYFGMQQAGSETEKHKNYGFFRICGQPTIPGSSIRGMVSSVYECLSNSCFRVMDQTRRLSWRMEADSELLREFVPGKIIRDKKTGKWQMEEMEEHLRVNKNNSKTPVPVRLPVYDNPALKDKNWTDAGKKINDHARQFRIILDKDGVSKRQCFPIYEKPNQYHEMDQLTVRLEGGVRKGYIKFSGPNKVEVNKTEKIPEKWKCSTEEPEKWSEVIHNNCDVKETEKRVRTKDEDWKLKKKTEYIPSYRLQKDGYIYTMSKRCERIFLEKPADEKTYFDISESLVSRYEQLLAEYRENAERNGIPEIFRTILPDNGTLNHGDLVYFRKNGSKVGDIAPVKISRIVDDQAIVQKLANNSHRSCAHTCTENCESCPERCSKVQDYFKPHPEGLCPACHVFGTTYYKSRVSFGMAGMKGKARWLCENPESPDKGGPLTLPLLERPRPTWSMPHKKSNIPGRKFYIHHPWTVEKLKNKAEKAYEHNRSIEALDQGNRFSFDVRFSNLREWELGLLIYSLELEEKMAHKLGMAKARGFGSVRISIEEIRIREGEKCPDKHTLIRKAFQRLDIGNMEKEKLTTHPHIRQLRQSLWFPDVQQDENLRKMEISYPTLEEEKRENGKGEKILIPGYADFVKQENPESGEKNPHFKNEKDRLGFLCTPWKEWHCLRT